MAGSRANTWVIDDQPWALICLLQNRHITFDSPTAATSVEEPLKLVGAEYRVPDE